MGGCQLWGGAWCQGGLPSLGVPGPRGCMVEGVCLVPGGSWSGGVCSQGVPSPGAWGMPGPGEVSQHALRQTTPVNRMTDRQM